MRAKIFTLLMILFILPISASAKKAKQDIKEQGKHTVNVPRAVLWRAPQGLATRNLFYGPTGKAGLPKEPFRFIEEDKGGSNPKFVIEDGRGVRWKVKLGEEAQSETAAARLLWAVGYFADEDYYLPKLRVEKLPHLSRGQEFVSANNVVRGARLERVNKGVKKEGNWSWFDNPFVGTKEFDGLRVMMALMNNWDLKTVNNGICKVQGRELRYVVTDLGGTFGKTGGSWSRSKNDVQDYVNSKFIADIKPGKVDFVLHSRPPVIYAVAVPYYHERAKMENVAEDIPRAHARWVGSWLAQLSAQQISDVFRAAGYAPHEVAAYSAKVRERIRQLNEL
jgi:hypothetical protein